jgi:hypothetical protein
VVEELADPGEAEEPELPDCDGCGSTMFDGANPRLLLSTAVFTNKIRIIRTIKPTPA